MNERNPNDTLSYIDLLNDKDLEKSQPCARSEHQQEEYLNTVNTFVDNERSIGQIFYQSNSQKDDTGSLNLEEDDRSSPFRHDIEAASVYGDRNDGGIVNPTAANPYPTAQTEFNQLVVSTSEQNDYLYEQLTRKNNLIGGLIPAFQENDENQFEIVDELNEF